MLRFQSTHCPTTGGLLYKIKGEVSSRSFRSSSVRSNLFLRMSECIDLTLSDSDGEAPPVVRPSKRKTANHSEPSHTTTIADGASTSSLLRGRAGVELGGIPKAKAEAEPLKRVRLESSRGGSSFLDALDARMRSSPDSSSSSSSSYTPAFLQNCLTDPVGALDLSVANRHHVSLEDIISGPVEAVYLFNYMFDLNWLLDTVPALTDIENIYFINGWKGDNAKVFNAAAKELGIHSHTVWMPDRFGVHHSKMVVAVYPTGMCCLSRVG